MSQTSDQNCIAIVGMAGRFPMAANVDEFWANLASGRDCFREFSVDELVAAGLPREVAADPNYVRRSPVLDKPAFFDALVFGYSPKEAELIDPQHRLLMECAWETLENAGHDPCCFDGAIGIWAGCGFSNYFSKNILSHPGHFESLSNFNTIVGSDKDYLVSRIAYKFNLRGPAVVVQTACSTSLVAVHHACQALLTYQCDMALAGGVSLQFPRAPGYFFNEGEIFSPDGIIRTFDKNANGTVLGEGCGLVALRRLENAIASGDRILAIIRGSAINNDGAARAGYTAPGVAGQSEVVAMAQAVAEVEAGDISHIEAHGTGTRLGDPIEVSALTKAFRQSTNERGFCALGTVKPSIGHLDVAAGVASLIKTVCALQHRQLPPTRNFTEPNPELGLESSPFYIVDRLMDWQPRKGRRLAGVSSLGLGGTNAHVVVEEYEGNQPPRITRPGWRMLPLSAATETALQTSRETLAHHLEANSRLPLDPVAYTLTHGRQRLRHRQCIVADNLSAAATRLAKPDEAYYCALGKAARSDRQVVSLFSGQGSQYPAMGSGLFKSNRVFREAVERCAAIIGPIAGQSSLLDILYGSDEKLGGLINQTVVSQPALFTIEYALARVWESHGIRPVAVLGHSIGEYVAACEAGIFSLEDALLLVKERARLMQSMTPGTMIAVLRTEAEVRSLMPPTLDLAVINAPMACVVSGPTEEADKFLSLLESKKINGQRLHTSHAFHSRMMEDAANALANVVARTKRHAPNLPICSNLTGGWMTEQAATDPAYWSRHLRNTVRFGDNLAEVARRFESALFLETGPGNTLCSITRQQPEPVGTIPAVASLRNPRQRIEDEPFFLRALGAMWCHGAAIELERLTADIAPERLTLPTYPFERVELYIKACHCKGQPAAEVSGGKKTPFGLFRRRRTVVDVGSNSREQVKPITLESLTAIWKDVLGVPEIKPEDNFFDLGGHSLLAVTVLNRIEKSFGVKLPLAALLNAPTLKRSFDRLTESSRTPVSQALVSIVRNGSQTPVFLFHSHGGNVLEYYRLATLLGNDRPVYALQCHGADGSPLTPMTMEEMARVYLKEIRTIQAKGPYLMGGYCFGGILAFEAALQLKAEGERTASVFMINSAINPYPFRKRPGVSTVRKIASRFIERLQLEKANLANKDTRETLIHIRTRAARLFSLACVKIQRLTMNKFNANRPRPLVFHLEELADNNDGAWLRYQPRPYDGRVLFIRAAKQPYEILPDPMLGWTGFLAGRVAAHSIDCFRQNLLDEPYVVEVAEIINKEILHS